MRRFARLFAELDSTTRTGEKHDALVRYFTEAPPEDAAWALVCIGGHKFGRPITRAVLRQAVLDHSGLPAWLLDESYEAVGDMSETIALVLPPPTRAKDLPLHQLIDHFILPLGYAEPAKAVAMLREAWDHLPENQRFLFHKLISGTFRVGVQRRMVARALAEVAGVEPAVMMHRLSGTIAPTAEAYRAVIAKEDSDDLRTRPYPFCLAHQLDTDPGEILGDVAQWIAEWKWDGIRAQLLRRGERTLLWSRGEELINSQFPEIEAIGRHLPDGTALDGEILAWRTGPGGSGGEPLPFNTLQHRLGRKDVQPGLFEDLSAVFMAFDVLEHESRDQRRTPLSDRRASLQSLVEPLVARGVPVRISPMVTGTTWEELAHARRSAAETRHAEGLMLKHLGSFYHAGRVRGDPANGEEGWWKWKLDPCTVDAVLIAAQPGSGRRAGLYTDYTFAVRDGEKLVTFAKAYSGLTQDEIREVDRFVRAHTLERKGPVRLVEPTLVFEIAFQEIQQSTRHKSGLAVRFPRISRWRKDKKAGEADTLDTLRKLLRAKRL